MLCEKAPNGLHVWVRIGGTSKYFECSLCELSEQEFIERTTKAVLGATTNIVAEAQRFMAEAAADRAWEAHRP